MEQGGAIFARIEAEKLSFLHDFIRYWKHSSEFPNIITRDDRDWLLLRRYGHRDNVPNWTPIRVNPGDRLTISSSLLPELSRGCREVIAFFYIEEWFDYQHWQAGELVRFMDGSDEGWDTVSGNPEAWEEECFFSAGSMEKRLADLKEYDELTPEHEQAIRSAWAKKIISEGATEPPVAIGKMLRAIEKHFGIWLRD